MLSQTTEYALRIVVHLASQSEGPVTIPELAQATRIPRDYLPKVLRHLARAGLVHSQRGPNGGSVLARAPEELTIFDVVQAVDPLQRIERPGRERAAADHEIALADRLERAVGRVEDARVEVRRSLLCRIE